MTLYNNPWIPRYGYWVGYTNILLSNPWVGLSMDGYKFLIPNPWVPLTKPIATICIDGTYLPPYLIYQGHGNLQTSWLQDFEPGKHNCYFASTPSGFTNEDLAFEWLVNIFDKATRKKAGNSRHWRLLWLDGHNSHLNLKFLH